MSMDYFYDAQIRRYLIQVARIFGGIKYAYKDSNNTTLYKTIPFVYAATNAQVQAIINGNSENTLTTIPIFSIYLASLKQNHQRRQDPTFVSRKNVTERGIDDQGAYTSEAGNKYTVEMLMPVAYDLTVKIDLITSNESQKWQILEQIMVLFNPEVELQTSTNAVDWTALTTVSLTDINITPAANNSTINDLTTLTFNVPIFINPPAKVKRSSLIREIIINIGNLSGYNNLVDADGKKFEDGEIMHTSVVTPQQAYLSISRCYTSKNIYYADLVKDTDCTPHDSTWTELLTEYGKFNNNESLMYLLQNITSYDKNKNTYVGKLSLDTDNKRRLIFTLDPNTLPHSSFPNNTISGIIDPNITTPASITNLSVGDSYLLLSNINKNTTAWGTIFYMNSPNSFGNYQAYENDIIQWDGKRWNIIFSSDNSSGDVYYTNKNNGDYLTWSNTEGLWRMSLDAVYAPGYWRLDL